MKKIFGILVDSFIANRIGITDHFLSEALASSLTDNLKRLYLQNDMHSAGTGNRINAAKDGSVRTDIIYWLDRSHNDPFENAFLDLMDHFIMYLNENCYTGIKSCEFHYTLYEAGSFYKKHLDRFRNDDSRQYSMIVYLNTGWRREDGGMLAIHQAGGISEIAPESGKTVFFSSSELEHEVLLTHRPRMSITGWLKK